MSEAGLATLEDRLISIGALVKGAAASAPRRSGYRALFERTGMEPAAFASEVAAFHGLPRASLETMRKGRALIDQFSSPFLREFAIFPYETDKGEARLAVADPSEQNVLRMMEMTLGGPDCAGGGCFRRS